MEAGETVADKETGKIGMCAVCGTEHKKPKEETIEPTAPKTGWRRGEGMAGVFDSGDTIRASIYPDSAFPPPYRTEGHHCLAHASFVKKGKDLRPHLDHFLHKVGFAPNQPRNIIQLPGRNGVEIPAIGKTWPTGVKEAYKNYWVSVDLDKPLQLHTGRHPKEYFAVSNLLIQSIMNITFDVDACKESTQQEFEEDLKKTIDGAVNYAFKAVAGVQGPWICHPEPQRIASGLYGKTGKHLYAHGGGKKEYVGYGEKGNSPTNWPRLSLDTSPFDNG